MNTHGLGQGLRERKKRRTYDAIQRAAITLFAERGYAATTIEDVAAAADVSPSTVFRYFPTKPDLVVLDAWDDVVRESLRRQPASVPFHVALKNAMSEAFSDINEQDLEIFVARQRLTAAVPELRAAMLDAVIGAAAEIEAMLVERRLEGHPDPDRLRVEAHTLASAIVGIISVEAMTSPRAFEPQYWPDIADTIAMLSTGFDL